MDIPYTSSTLTAGVALRVNAPNLFPPPTHTRIYYELPTGGARMTLRVYELGGRLVHTLVDGPQAGRGRSAVWDGRRVDGGEAAYGIYLYRLDGNGFRVQVR